MPWSINEHYLKLVSSTSPICKSSRTMGTPEEITNASQCGVSHGHSQPFCGDAAQPLHTTEHFNGWTGENPKGYTTSRRFHSWVDGGFFKATTDPDRAAITKQLNPAALLMRPASRDLASGQFQAVIDYILEQHRLVEPLYQLDKTGKLSKETPLPEDSFYINNWLLDRKCSATFGSPRGRKRRRTGFCRCTSLNVS